MRNLLAGLLVQLAAAIRPAAAPVILQPRPVTAADRAWAAASVAHLTTYADKMRDNAGKWAESAVAILAVIGLSTAFGGRDTLAELDRAAADTVVLLVMVALVCSGLALFSAALAAQGIPSEGWSDAGSFRRAQLRNARQSRFWLAISRTLVVVAFAVSALAVFVIWTAEGAEASTAPTLVVGADGSLACGELTVESGRLLIGGSPLPTAPLSFHTVPECPSE